MKKNLIIVALPLFVFFVGCQESDDSENRGTWSMQSTSVTEKLNDIVFDDENNGWIAGNSNTLLYSSAGESWETKHISDGNTYNLLSIDFLNADMGLISGEDVSNGHGAIFRTRNGGSSWDRIDINGEWQQVNSIAFADENAAYALADNQKLLKSADGGMNWDAIYEFDSRMEDLAVLNNDLWACGKNGNLHYSSDGGSNWMNRSPETDYWLSSVFFVDNNTGFAASAYGDAGVFKTENSGDNWETLINAPEDYISDLFFTDVSHGWFTAQNNIYYTINGKDWEMEATSNSSNLNALYFLSEHKGYAVGFNGTVLHYTK